MTPDAGHDLKLQRNAPSTHETIITFADEVLGPDGDMQETHLDECGDMSGSNTDHQPEFRA